MSAITHTWSYLGYEFRVWDEGKGAGVQLWASPNIPGPGYLIDVLAGEILALAKESEIQKARIAELETENAKGNLEPV